MTRKVRGGGALAAATMLIALASSSAPATADWPVYGRDLANSRDGGHDGPSLAQIPTLKQAWSFKSPAGDFTGTPVVANGVLVAGDYSGIVYALDAVTGKLRWSRKLNEPINGSAAIDPGAPNGATVYVPLAHVGRPRLVALSLGDGHTRWTRVLTDQSGSSVYSSPTYWNGTVYIGTSGPNGDASTARGSILALDAASGAVRWRTYTVPPGRDGGAVWSTPTIDIATGRLYVGTGNAYHAPAADTTDAILALDASTGAILAHYQAVGGDTFAADNPAGPDADFGASANLIRAPDGTALVGEGAKDGVYYTLDRATMKLAWKSTVGPGSAVGGVVGGTVYDGKRIYGSDALTSQVWALGSGGSSQWSSTDGGSLDFSPLAMANGVLYSADQAGSLTIRDGATGTVLKTLSLGGPTFGGISTVGGAVYVAVGLGPPPPPAPQQQSGAGSIVAFGDTSRSGAPGSHDGGGGGGAPPPRIRLSVRPRSVQAGRRTVFRFTARAASKPASGVLVRFAGRSGRTNAKGRVRIATRLRRGRHSARATKPGLRSRRVAVYAHRR
ncbi:MAG: hypothetical protein QOK25_1125 [Thermoleophilaceae bacterium]|nr:hypothetical protein [Thermoleophilaceae bacterium]